MTTQSNHLGDSMELIRGGFKRAGFGGLFGRQIKRSVRLANKRSRPFCGEVLGNSIRYTRVW